MGLNHLYQICKVYRSLATNVPGKSYVDKTTLFVGEYACRLSRQSGTQFKIGQPQTTLVPYMRMYLDYAADIKEGDQVEVDKRKFRVLFVYAPNNHHLEVELQGQGAEA